MGSGALPPLDSATLTPIVRRIVADPGATVVGERLGGLVMGLRYGFVAIAEKGTPR
jgi:hypothetical protein